MRRTQLLKLKAEAELTRMEKAPPPTAEPKGQGAGGGKNDPQAAGPAQAKPVDPKAIKAGYQKAIELAPRATDQMEHVVKSLKQKDAQSAYPPAEQARKILEEIQKAQPKDKEKDQKQQDQEKKKNEDQEKKDKQKEQQKDQQKKDQQKKEEEKKDQEKKDEQKKDAEKKKQEETSKSDEQKAEQKQQQVSPDRIEEALRKVRERQQEKRERDKLTKARVFGTIPVEKDW